MKIVCLPGLTKVSHQRISIYEKLLSLHFHTNRKICEINFGLCSLPSTNDKILGYSILESSKVGQPCLAITMQFMFQCFNYNGYHILKKKRYDIDTKSELVNFERNNILAVTFFKGDLF